MSDTVGKINLIRYCVREATNLAVLEGAKFSWLRRGYRWPFMSTL